MTSAGPWRYNGVMPLKIWSNHRFSDAARQKLQDELGDHKLLLPKSSTESNLVAGGSDPDARAADVLHGQPHVDDVTDGGAQWVALTSAGYTRYDKEAVKSALRGRDARLTNASSIYDEPCAQHVLAQMLAASRELPAALAAQAGFRWAAGQLRENSFLLRKQSVLILGYGAIARRLAEMLRPFDMTLTAVRRHPAGDEAIRCVTPDAVDDLLDKADHVVNVLPANDSTKGFVSADRIGRMRASAIYYSVGRGTTTDQAALLQALRDQKLRAAYLDVTDPEPPPADDPIWHTPRLRLTPHSAGGYAGEDLDLVDHFLANLRHFEQGEALTDRVI